MEDKKSFSGLLERMQVVADEKGWLHLLRRIFRKIFLFSWYCAFYPYYKLASRKKIFTFNGRQYTYFYRLDTWYNERVVEVPIIWEIVTAHHDKNILEVGNVLSHYFDVSYDILDKYELDDKVINEDVVTFTTKKKYDRIISISTLEHVGYDETPRDPAKILAAIENLRSILSANGKMIITWSLGYNSDLDNLLIQNKLPFTNQYYFKRISLHDWSPIEPATLAKEPRLLYNSPYFDGNYLVIAVID